MPAATPAAFTVLVPALPRGPRLDLVHRVAHFAWEPHEAAAALAPLLQSDDEDVQVAAAQTLAGLPPAARLARAELQRANRYRGTRARARAFAQALAAGAQ
jgi:hypothetical protein